MTTAAKDDPMIVLVGHCGPDMYMLKSAAGRMAPGARIETATVQAELDRYRDSKTPVVLLVNRELDGVFDTHSGIELIKSLTAEADPFVAMLISNFPEAQQEAQAAGALPGFGKQELYDEASGEKLRAALDHAGVN